MRAAAAIGADLVFRFAEDTNVAMPDALRFYPAIALFVELVLHGATGLGVSPRERRRTSYDVMTGEATLAEALVETGVPGLSLAPASPDLSGLDIELVDAPERAFRLQREIAEHRAAPPLDLVLIDCPPSLGDLTQAALAASSEVLMPIQCEFFAMEGLTQMIHVIRDVMQRRPGRLEFGGILLTMYDERTNLAQQVADEVRGVFGDLVFETLVPRNVRLAEAPSFGRPIHAYDLRSRGSQAYLELGREYLMRRENTHVG